MRVRFSISGVVETSRGSSALNGLIVVQLALQTLPAGVAAGTQIDCTIEIEKLPDVVMVGRPVTARARPRTRCTKSTRTAVTPR